MKIHIVNYGMGNIFSVQKKLIQEGGLVTISSDPKDISKADSDYVRKKFDLSLDEFEAILNSEPKSYKDYPNDKKWLTFIYNLYTKYIKS